MSVSLKIAIVIPARYGSSRLPGKPLLDIIGKPMIQHVYEQAMKVEGASSVVVATDDIRIVEAVNAFGGQCLMTSPEHNSGTDRLVELLTSIDADLILNIQGDEPLIRPADIQLLIEGMCADTSREIGTLYHKIPLEEAKNINSVKVVMGNNQKALYFSRSLIPYPRDGETASYCKHVGVYCYSRQVLAKYKDLTPSMLEQTESLEQLRFLSAGIDIYAWEIEPTGPGVDTPECLQKVRAILSGEEIPAQTSLDKIRLVITDVDGVLTDGGIYYDETGECIKRFHVRDGLGMRMLEESGIRVAALSGRDSPTLRKRLKDLKIELFQLGVKDKLLSCQQLMAEANVLASETAFIGDDSIDLPGFAACGISFAVADAPKYIRSAATHTLETRGGQGAFREVADTLLEAQGKSAIFDSVEGYSAAMTKMAQ